MFVGEEQVRQTSGQAAEEGDYWTMSYGGGRLLDDELWRRASIEQTIRCVRYLNPEFCLDVKDH